MLTSSSFSISDLLFIICLHSKVNMFMFQMQFDDMTLGAIIVMGIL